MSCLFNSFSALTGEKSQEIRNKICDWLATDPAIMDDLHASVVIQIESGKALAPYVQSMRSVNTWGGAIEIRAFVQLWKRPVRVFVKRLRRWIEFPYEGTKLDNPCNISWTGAHYEAIK